MSDHSGIEWTDATWNPVTGCTKVSPGRHWRRKKRARIRKEGECADSTISSQGGELKRARVAAGERLTADEIASRDEPFVTLLMRRIGELGFLYSGRGEPYFTNEKNVMMYHLLFFSKHPTGLTLWRGITRIEPSGQRRLF